MEALERGLSEWWNADLMDCGHKGYVRLEDGQCSQCYAQAEIARRKSQALNVPAKPVKPVSPTPERIGSIAAGAAEAQKQSEIAKKKAAAERQRRSRDNRRRLAEIEQNKAEAEKRKANAERQARSRANRGNAPKNA
jgi:hypothetical protein